MYQRVFVGGTFDRLHVGHVSLLKRAFAEGEHVTIGLTSDLFVNTYKHNPTIQSFDVRKHQLEAWVQSASLAERSEIISIDDAYEPAASGAWDAIIVTEETKGRALEINDRRETKSLPPLKLILVDVLRAEDGAIVSSTRIRNGDIDQTGSLVMPQALRTLLQKPMGVVQTNDTISLSLRDHLDAHIITVGDVTTKTLLDAGIVPTLAIIDFKVGRKSTLDLQSYKHQFSERITVQSGPGFISPEALSHIAHMDDTRQTLMIVQGEEDLLVLPVVVRAPVGSVVYYGQPGEGMVEVVVSEAKKKEARELLAQFNTTNPTNTTNNQIT